jgi:acetyltransferase-like isoleucine patch superfamily enzyme
MLPELSPATFAELTAYCNAADTNADNERRAALLGLGGRGINVAPGAIIRLGPAGSIGDECFIGLYAYVNGAVRIGARVLIGPHCSISAGNHVFDPATQSFTKRSPSEENWIEIGDGSWLAAGCIVTAGTRVGRANLVCANAVVTRSTPDHAIVAGTPARQVGRIDPRTGDYEWFAPPEGG